LNWFDSKVNQSQAFSNLFQNTISIKQPVKSKCQKDFFKRIKIKQPWIINYSGLKNSTSLDTHNQQQGSTCIPLGFGDIKAPCSKFSPYLMKTNPWFACVVLFEFDSICKTQKFACTKLQDIPGLKSTQEPVFNISFSARKPTKIL